MVGLFGYANWSMERRRAEIGFSLQREHWGKGIAIEALRAIVAFGFGTMDLNRIHAVACAENIASVRTLEHLGFTREGTLCDEYLLEGAFHDEAVYGLLRRDFPTSL